MAIIVLNVRPDRELIYTDETYDSIVQMIEAPVRYLRLHTTDGEKVTIQKNFIIKIMDDSTVPQE